MRYPTAACEGTSVNVHANTREGRSSQRRPVSRSASPPLTVVVARPARRRRRIAATVMPPFATAQRASRSSPDRQPARPGPHLVRTGHAPEAPTMPAPASALISAACRFAAAGPAHARPGSIQTRVSSRMDGRRMDISAREGRRNATPLHRARGCADQFAIAAVVHLDQLESRTWY